MSDVHQQSQPQVHDDELVPEDDAVIGRAFRWSIVVLLVIAIMVVGIVVWVRWDPVVEEEIRPKNPGEIVGIDRSAPEMPSVAFVDVAQESGIDFVHFDGGTGEKLLPETMGGGVAVFDYNNNGNADVLLLSGDDWPHDRASREDDSPSRGSSIVLYENDGSMQFRDVTDAAGLRDRFYGMGVAVGDTNNDGNVDVFATAVGPNRFFRNLGGRFEGATDEAGLAGREHEWSTSAGFFDMDNDGLLDLFVCNYIEWSRDIDIALNFTLNGRDRAYGPPTNYRGAHSSLYRNDPDMPGTFTEVGEKAGIHINNPATGLPLGKALALAFEDVDGDGYLDIFVANDTTQNFLFHNQRNGSFIEVGARAGVAFASNGQATGAMGIDAANYRNDEAIALAIGNFSNEMTSFYVSQTQPMTFSDEAVGEGIGSPTRLALSFGLFFFDYDLDGRVDLLQANGHIEDQINQIQASQHYKQPTQLFWNAGPERRSCYVEVPDEMRGDLATPIAGRGAAYADFDGDGDLDIILTQIGGPPQLLRNDQDLNHNWLRIKLIGNGETTNRDAIGAVVELTAGGITQRRLVMPTRSYLSQVELPVTFGLGESDAIESLRVVWPTSDGPVAQDIDLTHVNQSLIIQQD